MKKLLKENGWQLVFGIIIITLMLCFPKQFGDFVNAFNESPQSPMYLPNQLTK